MKSQIQDIIEENEMFKITEPGQIITTVVNYSLLAGGIALLFYLIWGAYQWLTSGDDKTKLTLAQQRLSQAVIGITILASVWAIFIIVRYFLGLEEILPIGEKKGIPSCPCGGYPPNCIPCGPLE